MTHLSEKKVLFKHRGKAIVLLKNIVKAGHDSVKNPFSKKALNRLIEIAESSRENRKKMIKAAVKAAKIHSSISWLNN